MGCMRYGSTSRLAHHHAVLFDMHFPNLTQCTDGNLALFLPRFAKIVVKKNQNKNKTGGGGDEAVDDMDL